MRRGEGHLGIRARGLSVTLGGRTVLRDVELEAHPGEVLALLGPNGAGKSTLLKALAGLLPYEGSVEIAETDVAALSPRNRARRISYVPQRSLLRSALSVEEVVALGRYVHGGSFGGMSKSDQEAIDHALMTAHADALRDRIFTQLSVGEQQRVLLARALASDAPILLARRANGRARRRRSNGGPALDQNARCTQTHARRRAPRPCRRAQHHGPGSVVERRMRGRAGRHARSHQRRADSRGVRREAHRECSHWLRARLRNREPGVT